MLQRISILERQSGCPLYDRIWDWKADQHEPDCTSTLNLFFRQLGLTINDQVVGVEFESPVANDRKSSRQNTTVSHGGLAQYNAQVYTGPDSDLVDPVVSQMLGLTPSSSAQALQLQRAQNHIADVNIYYTGQPHVKIESFTEAVLTAFCGQFAAELTEQLPRFQYVQTLNEEAPRHTEFLALFSAFSDTLDRMELPSGLKYPAANAAPSPNSIDPADTEEKEKQTRTASV